MSRGYMKSLLNGTYFRWFGGWVEGTREADVLNLAQAGYVARKHGLADHEWILTTDAPSDAEPTIIDTATGQEY